MIAFNWREYLIVARQFVGLAATSPNQQALLRSAVSRAYYAVFILARNYVRDNDKTNFGSNADAHTKLIGYFIGNPNARRKRIGFALRNLRIQRNRADYNDVFVNLARNANSSITEAQRIIDIIASL